MTGGLLDIRKWYDQGPGSDGLLLHSPERRGGIEQTFPTEKGRRYRVTFALSTNSNHGNRSPEDTATTIRVSAAGGSQKFTVDCANWKLEEICWTQQEWEFVALADKTTLAFTTEETNKGYWHGPAVADVWVEAVPKH